MSKVYLEVKDLHVDYQGVPALRGVGLAVDSGELVSLIGSNGAGKTSLLRAISGMVAPTKGEIMIDGTRVDGFSSHRIVREGVAHVPEGRKLFTQMTVFENLKVASYLLSQGEREQQLEFVLSTFPILRERSSQRAGNLSGGQQQMLAIARALMSKPKLLLLDEPSVGLAPKVVVDIGETIQRIAQEHEVSVVLVEQNVHLALAVANRTYVLTLGQVAFSGSSSTLRDDPRLKEAYLSSAGTNKGQLK